MGMVIVEIEPGQLFRVSEEVAKANGWTEFKKVAVEAKPAANKAAKPQAAKKAAAPKAEPKEVVEEETEADA